MNTVEASPATRFKVGLFTIVGLIFIGVLTVYVNDRPYWYRPCQLVHISVEDATGLKTKSPIRSLGLEIGYLKSVELRETSVSLGICITAPVEVLPSTRAYLRGEGFLGDKFVELKPVKYLGGTSEKPNPQTSLRAPAHPALLLASVFLSGAQAEEAVAETVPQPAATGARRGEGREIPVGSQSQDMQQIVNRVDRLVNEMTNLTSNLKGAINPEELRSTMKQLNRTLENASRTLSPEGGLNQTAQRSLAKLEDAIEQLRSIMTRINQGEGSVGKLLNDPTYADEIREAIKNVNRLLTKVGDVRFLVDIGGEQMHGYDGGRGWFKLQIWPKKDRYYHLGVSMDPRGRREETLVTTTSGGVSVEQHTISLEKSGPLFTAMVGKVWYDRFDTSIGALNGDGAVSLTINLGPAYDLSLVQLTNDVYSRSGTGIDDRISVTVRPFMALYLRAGFESLRKVNGKPDYFYGAGVAFDDEDIKLLFTLR